MSDKVAPLVNFPTPKQVNIALKEGISVERD